VAGPVRIGGYRRGGPLNASLLRYAGHPAYDITRLKADLARFTFLLGDDTDSALFQPPTP
jgi:hypothetical protein